MQSLQEIKDQVAQETANENHPSNNFESWHDLRTGFLATEDMEEVINEVARRYAKAYAEADRKDCAEKAEVLWKECGSDCRAKVDKSSILDRPYPKMK